MRQSIGQGAILSVGGNKQASPIGWVAAALLLAGTIATISVAHVQVQQSFVNVVAVMLLGWA